MRYLIFAICIFMMGCKPGELPNNLQLDGDVIDVQEIDAGDEINFTPVETTLCCEKDAG